MSNAAVEYGSSLVITYSRVTSRFADMNAASVELTPELRAQHRIPEWADGSDLRPGEELEKYALRKRVAGPPRDLSVFIGEGGRRRDP